MSSIWSKLVNLAGNITGTLGLANGGTGQTTANTALNALLPTQATNSGKFLTTDGTNTSWGGALSTALPTNQLFIGVAGVATATAVTGDITFSAGATTLASTLSGTKTWNDAQTWKVGAGVTTIGSQDATNKNWTIGNTAAKVTGGTAGTYPGQHIVGRNDGNAPSQGELGETVALPSAPTVASPYTVGASASTASITGSTQLPLQGGVWSLSGHIGLQNGGATIVTYIRAEISTSSTAFNNPPTTITTPGSNGLDVSGVALPATITLANGNFNLALPTVTVSNTGGGTQGSLYLVLRVDYTGSAPTAYGTITATRVA